MKAMRLKELKKPICPESLAIRSSRVHMKPKFACPQSSVHYPVLPTAGLYPTSFPAVYHSPLPHHTQHRTSTWEASIDISGTELKKYEHFFLRQDPSHPFLCHVPKGWPHGQWSPRAWPGHHGGREAHSFIYSVGGQESGGKRNLAGICCLSFNSVNLVGDSMVLSFLVASAFPQVHWLYSHRSPAVCQKVSPHVSVHLL